MEHEPTGPTGPVGVTDPERTGPRATTVQRVREVFAGEGFRRFFVARAISQVGDGIFQIAAAAVLLFEDPGDTPITKLFIISAVVLVPFSVISPFSGVFIDRWERRSILTWVPIMRAGFAALLPVAALGGTEGIAFYAVVLIVLSANRFFLATMSAVLPQLVPEDDLIVANSVSSTGGSVANVVGLGLGTALAGLVGGSQAAAIAAVAFVISALTARLVPVHRGLPAHRISVREEIAEVLRQMAEGLRAVRDDRRVRFAMSAIGTVQFLVGAVTAVLFYAFIVVLELPVEDATAVLGVLAVGIGVGIVFVPPIANRFRHDLLIPISFVIAGLGVILAAAGDISRVRLSVGTFFVGISYAFAKIPVDTIVQEQMADQIRGRAFAAYDMLFNIARVTGVGIMAIAYRYEPSTRMLIVAIGIAYLIVSVGAAIWERLLHRRGWIPTAADLLQPGEVVTVRAYAGMRADEEPRAIVIGGHELVIDAIEWRAVVEQEGRRSRVFVCRVAGSRVRLAHREDDDTGWEIESVSPGLEPTPL